MADICQLLCKPSPYRPEALTGAKLSISVKGASADTISGGQPEWRRLPHRRLLPAWAHRGRRAHIAPDRAHALELASPNQGKPKSAPASNSLCGKPCVNIHWWQSDSLTG